jgi:hypothetical protein
MTDRHIRILQLIAQHRQRDLRSYDASPYDGDLGSPDHRQYLVRAATRTTARVADAQARRHRGNTRPGRDPKTTSGPRALRAMPPDRR